MKQITKISFFIFAFFTFTQVEAQTKKIASEEVEIVGVCKMCKDRIEDAALGVKGVKMATWSAQTQKLKVYYKTKHTNLLQIQQAIATAGHDTKEVQATQEAYQKLPDCCAYRDGVEVH